MSTSAKTHTHKPHAGPLLLPRAKQRDEVQVITVNILERPGFGFETPYWGIGFILSGVTY